MIKVAILFGGGGSEHNVSLLSAKNVLDNIDRDIFDVLEVSIDRDKRYSLVGKIFEENNGIQELKNRKVEVAFPIIHGKYGEDGELQEKLEKAGIKFIGASSHSSSITIDKNKTNEILLKNNIKIPKSKIISKEDDVFIFPYPVIIKPVDEGSSIDLFKFDNENEYKNSKDIIFKNHTTMLAQEFVSGREFTCGVIEIEGKVSPLVATEVILTKGKLFDYEAKYTIGGCKEITPAEVDNVIMKSLQGMAVTCHKILECRSISRTDIILKDDDIYVLEINTVPGMTKTSFIPQQAKACGYSMKELITILIESVNY